MISSSFAVFAAVCIMALALALLGLCVVVYTLAGHVYDLRGRLRRAEQEQIRSNRGFSNIVCLATELKESAEKAAAASDSCSKNLAFMYGEMINLRTEVKRWAHKPKHLASECSDKEKSV